MLWGLGPALDLLSEYEKVSALFGLKEINILLIGSTDGRHILKTLSTLRRHPVDDTIINIFVMDLAIELVARQLLLLTIALEPDGQLGAQEKSRLWMEIYGNTLLRPVTARYVISKAVQLIHMVTNKEFLNKRMPMLDLQHMKYKEIDQMENIFKYWVTNRYSFVKIWDIKLRKLLGTRYDAKLGVFDWDYNMKLLGIEDGQRVCSSEYKMWRKSALDLIEELKKVRDIDGKSVVNILLMGSTDARHILKTMSFLKRHSSFIKVNFFVMDTAQELVARQMLLLIIALEPRKQLGPIEKSRLWMEVYGNTLVRCSTAKYVVHKMGQLRLMLDDREFLKRRMPLIDLSLLRYLDIDELEGVARFYQNNKEYMMSKVWDIKLRDRLESDYDYRDHVFDWAYSLALVRIPGGHRVCQSEYVHWRYTGIAFTWLETDYSVGNPTFAVGIGAQGDSLYSLGYMGDMISGPYFAFGTDSEEKPMLEVRNGCNLRRATDITERNLQRIFHELEHGSPPSDLYGASIDMGLVMMKPSALDVDREFKLDFEPDRTPEDYSAIPVPNCRVVFLPGNAMELFPKKTKYKEFFDIIFVAQNFFKFLNEDIMSMAKPNGCLIIETRKFVIEVHKDIGKFGKEVRSKLKKIGWEEVTKCHFRRNDHAVCRKKKGDSQPQDESDTVSEDEEKDTRSAFDKIYSPSTNEDPTKDEDKENSEEPESLQLKQEKKETDSIPTTDSNDLGCDVLKNDVLRQANDVLAAAEEINGEGETQDKTETMETIAKSIREDEMLDTNLENKKSILEEQSDTSNTIKGPNEDTVVPEEANLAMSLSKNLTTDTAFKDGEKTGYIKAVGSSLENLMDDIKTCSLNKPSGSV